MDSKEQSKPKKADCLLTAQGNNCSRLRLANKLQSMEFLECADCGWYRPEHERRCALPLEKDEDGLCCKHVGDAPEWGAEQSGNTPPGTD